jgi:serine/threonine protein kinase
VPGFLKYDPALDYVLTRQIAEGGMSRVFLCQVKNPKLLQAAGCPLCISKVARPDGKFTLAMLHHEVALHYHVQRHDNIAKVIGYSEDPLTMLMQYYPAGSLQSLISNPIIRWSSQKMANLAFDVSSGIQHMHRMSVAHCDIKTANILIHEPMSRRLCAVITDLGIAQVQNGKPNVVAGFQFVRLNGMSMRYAAPEAFKQLKQKAAVPTFELLKARDVYALACVIYEMATRTAPWSK